MSPQPKTIFTGDNLPIMRSMNTAKVAELVVKRIKDDQGMFEDIISRTDIPKRTDIGNIPRYNSPKNKTQLYGEQGGDCNGCGEHFQTQHLEVCPFCWRN